MQKFFVGIVTLGTALFAQEPPATRMQIEQELQQAQRDFQTAQQMFIPYYTGPLITGSAENVPKGKINIQPYLYGTINYAEFNNSRHSKGMSNIYVFNPVFVFQTGITEWLDFTIIPEAICSWRKGQSSQLFGDLPIQFGIQLRNMSENAPAIRFLVGENFPSGKYNKLTPARADILTSGAGVYATTLGLNLSQLFWWQALHPIRLRLATLYTIPNHNAYVQGVNAYGGGQGTSGQVDVGQSFDADFGFEMSLTEKWVFAADLAYSFQAKSKFSGKPGTVNGLPAPNGAPSSDNLSIAPAIEYNPNDTGGFIGGIWLPITGRNSTNFISLVLSYTQLF